MPFQVNSSANSIGMTQLRSVSAKTVDFSIFRSKKRPSFLKTQAFLQTKLR
jgi:hypothetical protein